MKDLQHIVVTYKPSKSNLLRYKKIIQNLTFIDNSEDNRGYGGGANVGIKKALKDGAEWVVIMNQDLELTKLGIGDLEKAISDSPPGIVGAFAGDLDKRRWTTILPAKHVGYISGSCMAIHRDVIDKIGYFYDPYFMYYEDADYCARAKKAGFPLTFASIQGISHEDNPTLKKGSYLLEYYLSRNHLLFVEREAPLGVKAYEYLRLPKTLYDYWRAGNRGGFDGVKDYLLRRFGEKKV